MLIETTAPRILVLGALLGEPDRSIAALLEWVLPHELLPSILGTGTVSLAAGRNEVGNVMGSNTKTECVGYGGLNPVVWHSGQTQCRPQMTHEGRRML